MVAKGLEVEGLFAASKASCCRSVTYLLSVLSGKFAVVTLTTPVLPFHEVTPAVLLVFCHTTPVCTIISPFAKVILPEPKFCVPSVEQIYVLFTVPVASESVGVLVLASHVPLRSYTLKGI